MAIWLERRALQDVGRLTELVIYSVGPNETKSQIELCCDRIATKASELKATALRVAASYRTERFHRSGFSIPAPLESVVDHYVIDPIVVFAGRARYESACRVDGRGRSSMHFNHCAASH